MNEDVMWQRLKDIQREVENQRLIGRRSMPSPWDLIKLLGRRVWLIAGLAMRRPPRGAPFQVTDEERDTASDAA
jgi:hypothetical protein